LQRQELYARLAEIEYQKISNSLWGLDREAAEIRLTLSRMDLEKAREAVERTRLYAPISGRIVYRAYLQADDFIQSYTSLFSIADLSQISLRVSDDLASKVPVGAAVRVIVDKETHYGTVVQAPVMNPSDASDRNVAVIDSPTIKLEQNRLGRSYPVFFERASAEDVIVIERSLVRMNTGRTYVIVLINNIPVERNVVVGISNNSYIEIVDGLREGELIVQ